MRSGSYPNNIAQLEATAERFSMTSSIEDAIREAHQELKRSDSQRSSILAASVKNLNLEHASGSSTSLPLPSARQSSIVGINNGGQIRRLLSQRIHNVAQPLTFGPQDAFGEQEQRLGVWIGRVSL